MTDNKETNASLNQSKRKLLKTAAIGGGVASVAAMPKQWTQPIVASVILPAHAEQTPQTGTSGLGSADNCPPENFVNKYFSGPISTDFTVTDGTADQTVFNYAGGFLTGGTSDTDSYTAPGACSDASDLIGRYSFNASAGGGTITYDISSSKYCGTTLIGTTKQGFEATFTGATTMGTVVERNYSGSKYLSAQVCDLLAPDDGSVLPAGKELGHRIR